MQPGLEVCAVILLGPSASFSFSAPLGTWRESSTASLGNAGPCVSGSSSEGHPLPFTITLAEIPSFPHPLLSVPPSAQARLVWWGDCGVAPLCPQT